MKAKKEISQVEELENPTVEHYRYRPYKSLLPERSLMHSALLQYKKIPSKTCVLKTRENEFGRINKLGVVAFNNKVYACYEAVQIWLEHYSTKPSTASLIKLINEGVIDYEGVCLVRDRPIIKGLWRIDHGFDGFDGINDEPFSCPPETLPETIALISMENVEKLVEHKRQSTIAPFLETVKEKGYYEYRKFISEFRNFETVSLTDVSDYIKHHPNGDIINRCKEAMSVFKPYIATEKAWSDKSE